MGKLRAFEVVFEGENVNLFHAGDTVKGFVRIVLAAPKKDIRGKAKLMFFQLANQNNFIIISLNFSIVCV